MRREDFLYEQEALTSGRTFDLLKQTERRTAQKSIPVAAPHLENQGSGSSQAGIQAVCAAVALETLRGLKTGDTPKHTARRRIRKTVRKTDRVYTLNPFMAFRCHLQHTIREHLPSLKKYYPDITTECKYVSALASHIWKMSPDAVLEVAVNHRLHLQSRRAVQQHTIDMQRIDECTDNLRSERVSAAEEEQEAFVGRRAPAVQQRIQCPLRGTLKCLALDLRELERVVPQDQKKVTLRKRRRVEYALERVVQRRPERDGGGLRVDTSNHITRASQALSERVPASPSSSGFVMEPSAEVRRPYKRWRVAGHSDRAPGDAVAGLAYLHDMGIAHPDMPAL
ncbi:hypothetical protein AURDEDRAFT_176960 [Auricularia subglabra TFB-10046 SS5]|uniref:Uncharacterized protein n=1 Tax=Auricularia subglabra (strain TFB-10046 / SS5) TaxID=717982 RepID=J0CUH9_AURST|nr:hypothetical protein AURDEDRAFT_176960 [Auricularia subglabra TFB-10046 SS5]